MNGDVSKTAETDIQVFNLVPLQEDRLPRGYVNVTDAARWLRVSDETVRRWIQSGRLEGIQTRVAARGREGWRWLVPTEALNALRRNLKAVMTHHLGTS